MSEISLKEKYGKVAVLYGGDSHEREISLKSGRGVYDALVQKGVDATLIDTKDGLIQPLTAGQYDRAFIILHGAEGEDGTVQAILSHLNIPFTGSGMTASAVCMEKRHAKRIWLQEGLPTIPYREVRHVNEQDDIIADMGLPLCLKPSADGSSIGVSKVTTPEGFAPAFAAAQKGEGVVIAEPWIQGKELTVPVIGRCAYPSVEIDTPRAFYDYAAKYEENTTRYLCPSRLSAEKERAIQAIAMKAYDAVGCEGWARVDFKMDANQNFYIIEINTVPGMTSRSLVPMSAKSKGIEYIDVLLMILDQTLTENSPNNEKLVVNILSESVE